MKIKLILLVALLTSIATFSQKQWTLKECVDEALAKNISIQQNKLSLELQKKEVDIAKGNFLPNLNGSSSGRFGFGSFIDNVSNQRISTDNFNASFDLNSNMTIFNGFRNTNTYKQAQLGVESSLLDLKKIENDISLFVVNGYLNVLFAKENLNASKIQSEISKTQIEAAESRFNAGVIPKGDLLNTQATAATDSQTVIANENSLDLALLNLSQLLQVPYVGFDVANINVGTPSANLFYKNSNYVYDKSLERLPEIERAKLAIEDANFNIELSKSSYLPTLSVFANMGSGFSHRFNEIFTNDYFFKQLNDNLGYSIGVSLNVPIFNRFQTKNRVAQSKIQ